MQRELEPFTLVPCCRRLTDSPAELNGSAASAPLRWTAIRPRKPQRQRQLEFTEENDWKNDMVLWTLPSRLSAAMPRVVRAWYRCYVMCMGMCVPSPTCFNSQPCLRSAATTEPLIIQLACVLRRLIVADALMLPPLA